MEDAMEIFEYAMKMEEDGRAFYLEHAEKTRNTGLKSILVELAEDELKHYNIYKAMRDSQSAEFREDEKTTVLSSVKNVFESMRTEGKDMQLQGNDLRVWEEAREIEAKSETFYREKAGEIDNDGQKSMLIRIADEEHKHWTAIESVIRFLERPQQWLEDAEWSNLDDY
jgi:rubrerythrin